MNDNRTKKMKATSISLDVEMIDELQDIAFKNKKLKSDNATVSRIVQNALEVYLPLIRE